MPVKASNKTQQPDQFKLPPTAHTHETNRMVKYTRMYSVCVCAHASHAGNARLEREVYG